MNDFRTLAHFLHRRVPDTSLRGLLRTFPASILLASTITLCGLATRHLTEAQYQPVLQKFGLDYEIIQDARFWHILTPLFIQPSPGIGWKMIVLVVGACAMRARPHCSLSCVVAVAVARAVAMGALADYSPFFDVSE